MMKCILLALLIAAASASCGCVNTGADIGTLPGGIPSNFCLDTADAHCDDYNAFSTPNGDGSDRFQCLCSVCQDDGTGSICPSSDEPRCNCEDDTGTINFGVTPKFCFPFNTLTTCPTVADVCCCRAAASAPTDNCLANVDRATCTDGGDICEEFCCCEDASSPAGGACFSARQSLCEAGGVGRCAVPPTTAAPTTLAPTTEAPTTEAPTTDSPTTVAPTTDAPTTDAPTATTPQPTTPAPTTRQDLPCCCLGAGETECVEGVLESVCVKGNAQCVRPAEDTCCCDVNGGGVCVPGYAVSACVVSGFTCVTDAPTPAPTPEPTANPTSAPTHGPPCCCFAFGAQIGEPCQEGVFQDICEKGNGQCDVERCCCETTNGAEDCVEGFPMAQCIISQFSCSTSAPTTPAQTTPSPTTPSPTAAVTPSPTAPPTPARCCCYTHGQSLDDQCTIMDQAVCEKAGGFGCEVDRCCCDTNQPDGSCQPNYPAAMCNTDGFFCDSELCPCTIAGVVETIPITLCTKGGGVCDAIAPVEQDVCDCIPSDGSAIQLDVPVSVCEKGEGSCDVCNCIPFEGSTPVPGVPRRICTKGDGVCEVIAPEETCDCIPQDGSAVMPNVPVSVCIKGEGTCWVPTTGAPTTEQPTCRPQCVFPPSVEHPEGHIVFDAPEIACVKGEYSCVAPCEKVCQTFNPLTGHVDIVRGAPQSACVKGLYACCEEKCVFPPSAEHPDGLVQVGIPQSACVKGEWTCDPIITPQPTPAPTPCEQVCQTFNPMTGETEIVHGAPASACVKGVYGCLPVDPTTAAPTVATTTGAPTEATTTTAAPTAIGDTPAPTAATTAAPTVATTSAPTAEATTASPTIEKPTPPVPTKENDESCASSDECISGCCRFSVDTASLICRQGGGLRLCV